MSQEEEKSGTAARCQGCGAEIPQGKSFCRFCGQPVGNVPSSATPGTEHVRFPKGQPVWLLIGVAAIICLIILIALFLPGLIGSKGGQGSQPPMPLSPTIRSATPVVTPAVHTTSLPTPLQQGVRPVDTFPPERAVSIVVGQKDTSYATIPVTFAGGKGQINVRSISIRMTTSDGMVETHTMLPEKGAEVVLNGTRGTDRVEVNVTYYSGETLKVVDLDVPFKVLG